MVMESKTMSNIASSDSWVALTTIVAAATYLFDAASNVATASKYYQFYRQGHDRAQDEIGQSIVAGGAFIVVSTLIVVAHITNVVMFCTTPEGRTERPVRAAFFLPLIHLMRLAHVLGSTCSVHGFKDATSVEAARLYSILAAALETGPQLIFQYAVLHVVGSHCVDCKLPKVLLISVIGSLISGAYNGGAAVALITHETCKLSARLATGIIAGIHILCALIIRSFAFALIVTGTSTLYIVLYASTALGVPCVLFWVFTKPRAVQRESVTEAARSNDSLQTSNESCLGRQGRKLLQAVANGHVSLSLGPLYPLTRDARGRGLQGHSSFHGVLILASMAHLMLDIGGITFIYKMAFYKPSMGVDNYPPPCTSVEYHPDVFLPCSLFLVLLCLAVSLYILSMFAYVIIDKTIHRRQFFTIIPFMCVVLYQQWRLFFNLPRTATLDSSGAANVEPDAMFNNPLPLEFSGNTDISDRVLDKFPL